MVGTFLTGRTHLDLKRSKLSMPSGIPQLGPPFTRRLFKKMVKKMRSTLFLFFACFQILMSPRSAEADYSVDDGSFEIAYGDPGGNLSIAFLNQFYATDAEQVITEIDILFGPNTDGEAVTVYLWSDPNNDGNPNDAMVLASLAGVVQVENTAFSTYDIPDVQLNVGDSFFVGAIFEGAGGAVTVDTNSTFQGASWAALDTMGSLDPNNLNSGDFQLTLLGNNGSPFQEGNLLVRARGTTSIPEPASISVLLCAGVFVVGRWRHTR